MDVSGIATVPLMLWEPIHPAAMTNEVPVVIKSLPTSAGSRHAGLAKALAERNAGWGNPVERDLQSWLAGAEVIVAGQQPGLLGGPLLTLVKACAVAAEVRRRRQAGRSAVGFFWLATNDDDLPEMGWGRVVVGEEVKLTRETRWRRGDATAGKVQLSEAAAELLTELAARERGERGRAAVALASECYRPGVSLGEATGNFLARLLRGLGVVLVDALQPVLMLAARDTVVQILARLGEAWRLLEEGAGRMRARGWAVPLAPSPGRLPIFRLQDGRRQRLSARLGTCPLPILREMERHPERFSPNVWLRPLVQDAALGTTTAVLGGAELAYHLQAEHLWELAEVRRPLWWLRPHLTVVTAGERRLIQQLGLEPADLLSGHPPRRLLRGAQVERRRAAFTRLIAARLTALAEATRQELPSLTADVEATAVKVEGALEWLAHRTALARVRNSEVQTQRWRRLTAFLRPEGGVQERRLSVLAPLLRLGLEWPSQLAAALETPSPGMHLMCWNEGGPW